MACWERKELVKGPCRLVRLFSFSDVNNIPSDCPPDNLGWSPEVNGTLLGLCVHPLSEKTLIFGLLPDKPSRNACLLTSHNDLRQKIY